MHFYKIPILCLFQGKVVTETTTEYKEAATGDDSGFSDFGGPSFSSSKSSPFQLKGSETKPHESSTSSSSEDEEDSETATLKFQNDALESHNNYRKLHGVAPLKLDKTVIFIIGYYEHSCDLSLFFVL